MLLLNTLQEVPTIQSVLRMLEILMKVLQWACMKNLVIMSFQWCKKNKIVMYVQNYGVQLFILVGRSQDVEKCVPEVSCRHIY